MVSYEVAEGEHSGLQQGTSSQREGLMLSDLGWASGCASSPRGWSALDLFSTPRHSAAASLPRMHDLGAMHTSAPHDTLSAAEGLTLLSRADSTTAAFPASPAKAQCVPAPHDIRGGQVAGPAEPAHEPHAPPGPWHPPAGPSHPSVHGGPAAATTAAPGNHLLGLGDGKAVLPMDNLLREPLSSALWVGPGGGAVGRGAVSLSLQHGLPVATVAAVVTAPVPAPEEQEQQQRQGPQGEQGQQQQQQHQEQQMCQGEPTNLGTRVGSHWDQQQPQEQGSPQQQQQQQQQGQPSFQLLTPAPAVPVHCSRRMAAKRLRFQEDGVGGEGTGAADTDTAAGRRARAATAAAAATMAAAAAAAATAAYASPPEPVSVPVAEQALTQQLQASEPDEKDASEDYEPQQKKGKAAAAAQPAGALDMDAMASKRCNCKRSQCLKLYCECFASQLYCYGACACEGCKNTPEFAKVVQEKQLQIKTKNPKAFECKVIGVDDAGKALHVKGCHCKRSGCLKKYCECFGNSVVCSSNCKCLSCKNVDPAAFTAVGKGHKKGKGGQAAVAQPHMQGGAAAALGAGCTTGSGAAFDAMGLGVAGWAGNDVTAQQLLLGLAQLPCSGVGAQAAGGSGVAVRADGGGKHAHESDEEWMPGKEKPKGRPKLSKAAQQPQLAASQHWGQAMDVDPPPFQPAMQQGVQVCAGFVPVQSSLHAGAVVPTQQGLHGGATAALQHSMQGGMPEPMQQGAQSGGKVAAEVFHVVLKNLFQVAVQHRQQQQALSSVPASADQQQQQQQQQASQAATAPVAVPAAQQPTQSLAPPMQHGAGARPKATIRAAAGRPLLEEQGPGAFWPQGLPAGSHGGGGGKQQATQAESEPRRGHGQVAQQPQQQQQEQPQDEQHDLLLCDEMVDDALPSFTTPRGGAAVTEESGLYDMSPHALHRIPALPAAAAAAQPPCLSPLPARAPSLLSPAHGGFGSSAEAAPTFAGFKPYHAAAPPPDPLQFFALGRLSPQAPGLASRPPCGDAGPRATPLMQSMQVQLLVTPVRTQSLDRRMASPAGRGPAAAAQAPAAAGGQGQGQQQQPRQPSKPESKALARGAAGALFSAAGAAVTVPASLPPRPASRRPSDGAASGGSPVLMQQALMQQQAKVPSPKAANRGSAAGSSQGGAQGNPKLAALDYIFSRHSGPSPRHGEAGSSSCGIQAPPQQQQQQQRHLPAPPLKGATTAGVPVLRSHLSAPASAALMAAPGGTAAAARQAVHPLATPDAAPQQRQQRGSSIPGGMGTSAAAAMALSDSAAKRGSWPGASTNAAAAPAASGSLTTPLFTQGFFGSVFPASPPAQGQQQGSVQFKQEGMSPPGRRRMGPGLVVVRPPGK